MKHCETLIDAFLYSERYLRNTGQEIITESWQAIKEPIVMFESFDLAWKAPMPNDLDLLREVVRPHLPWADQHFEERVSGIPYNPPPSHAIWPFAIKNNTTHLNDQRFSHTYPERIWPKFAGVYLPERGITMDYLSESYGNIGVHDGIRYKLGDLNDVIELLIREPHTRQAYLPIWFPEDTGAVEGQRVPCTLGYLFRIINGHLHITYKIRSCDFFRHFRDDVYMAIRLADWVRQVIRSNSEQFYDLKLGYLKFQADSFHCFGRDMKLL